MPEKGKNKGKRAASYEEIAAFCEQASMLIRAGVSVAQSIETIVGDMPGGGLKEAYLKASRRVEETGKLSSGLEAGGIFPEYLIRMVKIGEKSGRLDDTLESLAIHYDRLQTFQNQIRSAVLYPMILIGIMAGVIFVLMNSVMPVFRQVYMELGSGASDATSAAMDFSAAAGTVIFIVLIVLFALIAILLAVWKSKAGAQALSGFTAKFPPTKGMSAKIATGKFASAMSIQLVSGIPPEPAVEMAASTVDNPGVAAKIEEMKRLAAQNVPWGRAIDQCGIFSDTENRLVKIGLKSGHLDKAMQKIAEVYDEEVGDNFNRVSGVIEPVMIAVLSAVIGVLLISVMLPLINIMSMIG
jgi:type IV pilus assembly protein PilC